MDHFHTCVYLELLNKTRLFNRGGHLIDLTVVSIEFHLFL